MKLLPNHIMVWYKLYYRLISDIIVIIFIQKRYWNLNIYLIFFYFVFNWSVNPLIFSTISGATARVRFYFPIFHIWSGVSRHGPKKCDFGHTKKVKKKKLDAIIKAILNIVVAIL